MQKWGYQHFDVTDRCSRDERREAARRWSTSSPRPAGLYQPGWSRRGWWGVPAMGCLTLNMSHPIPWACVSLARPRCCCSLPRQASWLLLPQTHSYWSYQGEKWSETWPMKTHKGCTSWKPRTPHVTSSWLNWERERQGALICLVYVIALVLGSYYSSPMSHAQRTEAQWGNHNINSAWLGLAPHTDTHNHVSCVSAKQFM